MIIYLLIAWALERIVYVLFYRPRGGSVSVRQTIVADHTPQALEDVSQTVTTERTSSTQTPKRE
jgi:hypothetical protein